MQHDDLEQAIDTALDDGPRARAYGAMVEALAERRTALQRDLSATEDMDKRHDIESRIRDIDRQVASLQQEQAVSEFVEMTVRAGALRAEVPDESLAEEEE